MSLGSATVGKDAKGNLADAKTWIIHEMHINVDLSQNKLQFFSKDFFDRDPFSLQKEISILNTITSPDIDNDQIKVFSGIDESGRKCIVKLKANKDEFKVEDGELQIEYNDRAEIYRLRKLRHNPVFNKS